MLIFAVEDEALSLETLRRVIRQAAPEAEVQTFMKGSQVLSALERGRAPDVVFSDIEMPGITGLELAAAIKRRAPETRLVFVTGYSEYALDAYRAHVSGYIMKPVTVERVREELGALQMGGDQRRLEVRCFGAFEVFWRGEPLIFPRKKTKELLAYLIHREGSACTGEEIITALWEGEGELSKRKAYLRTLTSDLKGALGEIGMGDVLIHTHRQWAVRPELLDCDYYRLRAGDRQARERFRGEYMSQYSWAEPTAGQLQFENSWE